jgi:phosphoglucosamine mutase
VAFAKNTFPRNISLVGLRLVVDAAHGAAYRVAPAVFSELGATVSAIGVQPDGVNINEGFGALHPDRARAEVVKSSAQMGIAFDGDADRVILIDEHGQVVDGDSVLAMCALELAETGLLKKSTVVATVMSNLGLERALFARKIRLVRTAVGDRHVVDAMRKGGFNLGGEQSGHLVFLDHASTGDGIVAALQVLALMLRKEKPLSELAAQAMTRVPQVLENVSLRRRRPLEKMKKLQAAMRSVSKSLGRRGRILVRWSGTEPKLRVMIEGENEAAIRRYAAALVEAARADFGPRS